MASIIPGYEYDIFVSYRQKDNKHDGWVTEFVDNLKGELEATFKEDVSVYFDINPHDGLLETHDVNASLKEKLKCLVFIPIISRTYCDPKSFAWEHEFRAFVELASQDQFGLKVKLQGGNVASRILPVQIHELDADDRKLVENELGGFLRGIEFIYREPGVNKPLATGDDEKRNLNNTKYRIQINKVANSIKEIIIGLKSPQRDGKEILKDINEEKSSVRKNLKTKIIAGTLILFALIVLGYFIVPKLIIPKEQLEKSIAVLPFRNFSEDLNQEFRSDALTNEIINHLYKIKSFDRVVPFTSVLGYKKTDKKHTLIADELNVNYILEGTYQRIGDSLKITANLIEPKTDNYIWQNDYEEPYREIISIQSDIALQIASHVNAFLTVSEKRNIQKVPTTNMEAFDLLQQAGSIAMTGDSADFYHAKDLVTKAIELDPNYADAYSMAGMLSLYSGKGEMSTVIREAMPDIKKALELDQDNSAAHLLMGNIFEWGQWNYIEAEKEYLKFKQLAPNISIVEFAGLIGEFYLKMNLVKKAMPYINIPNGIESPILENMGLKSFILSDRKQEALNYINKNLKLLRKYGYWLGEDYIWVQEYDSARLYLDYALKSEDQTNQTPRFQSELALSYYKTNKIDQSRQIINQLIGKTKKSLSESPDYFIGWFYSGAGEVDSAFYWLEKAYKNRSPEFPWLKVDPVFRSLKGDKRYWDLYKRTGHKAYDDYIAGMKKK